MIEPETSTPGDALSPWKLEMATRGYYIQSKILHIPDRFGFLSPGPPSLQVFDVDGVIALLVYLSIMCAIEALVLIHSWLYEYFRWFIVYLFLWTNCELIVGMWIITCIGHYFKRGHGEGSRTASIVVEEKARGSDAVIGRQGSSLGFGIQLRSHGESGLDKDKDD
jgi:hypothetical protein